MLVIDPESARPVPSIPPNTASSAVPEKVEDESVAAPSATNFPVESSKPKKPTFAPDELYLNLIPLSRLSSELSSPISKTGSAIETVVELTVVVVPDTVKLPVTVKSFPPEIVKSLAMFVRPDTVLEKVTGSENVKALEFEVLIVLPC